MASAQEASTTACPCAARRSGPPGSDWASATPIGRKRELMSAASTTAVPAPPPEATIATAVNCADPANTMNDIAIAALYLASPAGSFVTGKVLEVDGGIEYPNLALNLPDL